MLVLASFFIFFKNNLSLVISSNQSIILLVSLERFHKQVLKTDSETFGQVNRKFSDSPVLCRFVLEDTGFKTKIVKIF